MMKINNKMPPPMVMPAWPKARFSNNDVGDGSRIFWALGSLLVTAAESFMPCPPLVHPDPRVEKRVEHIGAERQHDIESCHR